MCGRTDLTLDADAPRRRAPGSRWMLSELGISGRWSNELIAELVREPESNCRAVVVEAADRFCRQPLHPKRHKEVAEPRHALLNLAMEHCDSGANVGGIVPAHGESM